MGKEYLIHFPVYLFRSMHGFVTTDCNLEIKFTGSSIYLVSEVKPRFVYNPSD